jgi:endonuclease YncB( thermonuclease family)
MIRKLLLAGAAPLTCALLLAPAHAAWAYDAVVDHCVDGDRCMLTNGGHVRLHAIDAPELDQPYGPQAGALINQLIAGRHVDVRPTGDSSYGRTVADLIMSDGENVGVIMVERGLAWVEVRWNTDPEQPARERVARENHLGLWADAHPTAPWEWRHEHEHHNPRRTSPGSRWPR